MALEFICSQTIEKGKRIPIPNSGCNLYKIKSGQIRFFKGEPDPNQEMKRSKSNPEKGKKVIFPLPKNSETISFDQYQTHPNWVSYGDPTFYDQEGNIINA